jgi:hypothetical protein
MFPQKAYPARQIVPADPAGQIGCFVKLARLERGRSKEATAGFEPAIGVLQTPALPLGHVAIKLPSSHLERMVTAE